MGQWSVRASGGDRCHSVSAVLRAASLTGAPRVTSALPRVVRPSEFSTSMVVPAGALTAQRPHFWMKRNLSGMHEGGTDIPRNPTGSFLAEVTSACQLITGAEHDDTEGRKDRTGQLIPPLPFSPSSSPGPGQGQRWTWGVGVRECHENLVQRFRSSGKRVGPTRPTAVWPAMPRSSYRLLSVHSGVLSDENQAGNSHIVFFISVGIK